MKVVVLPHLKKGCFYIPYLYCGLLEVQFLHTVPILWLVGRINGDL